MTSSNGRISATSSGSRRSLRPMSASRRARRAREKSPCASAWENPEATRSLCGAGRLSRERPGTGFALWANTRKGTRPPGPAFPLGGGRVVGKCLVDGRGESEDAVEPCDLERLGDRLAVAHDQQRAAAELEPAVGADQHAEAGGVDERGLGQIHDDARAA